MEVGVSGAELGLFLQRLVSQAGSLSNYGSYLYDTAGADGAGVTAFLKYIYTATG